MYKHFYVKETVGGVSYNKAHFEFGKTVDEKVLFSLYRRGDDYTSYTCMTKEEFLEFFKKLEEVKKELQ